MVERLSGELRVKLYGLKFNCWCSSLNPHYNPKSYRLHTHTASNPCLRDQCSWPGERCQVDSFGQAKCVCPDNCPHVMAPVCGSDGITYDSHCHLERKACAKTHSIWVVYAGQCSKFWWALPMLLWVVLSSFVLMRNIKMMNVEKVKFNKFVMSKHEHNDCIFVPVHLRCYL